MKTILIIIITLLLPGCGLQYIDTPPPDEYERWGKTNALPEDVKRSLRDCGYNESKWSFEKKYNVDNCMLGKGFRFIDPVRERSRCDYPMSGKLPSCQSLK